LTRENARIKGRFERTSLPCAIPRMRTRSFLVLVLCLALVLGALQPGVAGERARAHRHRVQKLVNKVRLRYDRPRLRLKKPLSKDAWRHSRRMARSGSLFHSRDLASLVRPYSAHYWGENLGVGPRLRDIVRMWMRSASHRANVLNRHYRRSGVGVVRTGGRFWVTMIYFG
jgi:uncharacterized protein YkwD